MGLPYRLAMKISRCSFYLGVTLIFCLTASLNGQTIHSSQGFNCIEYTLNSDNTMVGKQYTNGVITKYINGTWSQSTYQRSYETAVTIKSSGYSAILSAYYTASGNLEQFRDPQGRTWATGVCGDSQRSTQQEEYSSRTRTETSKFFDIEHFIQYSLGSTKILVSKYPWRYIDVQTAMREKQIIVNDNDAFYIPTTRELSLIKNRINLPEDIRSDDYYIWSCDQYPPGSGEIVVVNFASNSDERKTAGSKETSRLGVRPIFISRRNSSLDIVKSLKYFKDDLYFTPVLESYTKEDISILLKKLGPSFRTASKSEIEALQLSNSIGTNHAMGSSYMFRHLFAPVLSLNDPTPVYDYFYYDYVLIKKISPEEKAELEKQAEVQRKRDELLAAKKRLPLGEFTTFNVLLTKESDEVIKAFANVDKKGEFRDSLLYIRDQLFRGYTSCSNFGWLYSNNKMYLGIPGENLNQKSLKYYNKQLSDLRYPLPKIKLSDFKESINLISWYENPCFCLDNSNRNWGSMNLGINCIEIIKSKEEYDTLKTIYLLERITSKLLSKDSKFNYCD